MSQLSRRSFLRGLTASAVGLPFLSSFHGLASAQAARPRRLVLVFHPQGTIASRFKPSAVGALPSTLPDLLTPLAAHRARMNVITGVDNVVSALNTASNGHNTAGRSLFTCQPFVGVKQGQSPDNGPADGPSFDWSVGKRLQGDAPRAVVNLGVTDGGLGEYTAFWQASGQAANVLADPRAAADSLFASIASSVASTAAVATPSRADLLRGRRGNGVDSVLESFRRLSARVPQEDRARLEAHMDQLSSLNRVTGVSGGQAVASCAKPTLPALAGSYSASSSDNDDKSASAQIDNIAMLLACDVTRVATLQFTEYGDPRFPFAFGGDRGAAVRGSQSYSDWHAMVHEARAAADTQGQNNLATGFRWYMSQVALLADRLAGIADGPGQTLLDNTVIVAISEFGDGASHATSDLPITMIGNLGGRIKTGQRIDATGYTTGDLYTTLQSLLVDDSTPFGMTGARSDGRAFHRGLLPNLT